MKFLGDQPVAAAVLNFRVKHGNTADLARTLIGLGIPVLFVLGDAGSAEVPSDLRDCEWMSNPIVRVDLVKALQRLTARIRGSQTRSPDPLAISERTE